MNFGSPWGGVSGATCLNSNAHFHEQAGYDGCYELLNDQFANVRSLFLS
jgi:hypothetical protein